MNFIRNRNFRAGPQTSLEGFICPQNSDKQQKIKVFGRSGGVGYYHLANMKRFLMETDEWLRRRLRMCIWKSWKRVKTRIANLIKCGIDKYQAYMWGNSRLGDWRIAGSYILVIGTAVCGTARTVV